MSSERIDKFLLDLGLVSSRSQAQACVRDGLVEIQQGGRWIPVQKASQKVPRESQVRLDREALCPYVSRAGTKLESALRQMVSMNILPGPLQHCARGIDALDVGQSTGGFSDCLCQHGAQSVLGIDVGHDQLAPSLIHHERISCWQGVNARYLPVDELLAAKPKGFDWIVMDVSFISQTLILPGLSAVMKNGSYLISLVKPQFEVGQSGLGKGGLVKDPAWYPRVHQKISEALRTSGLEELAWFESGITGGDGNREFFVVARRI